MAREGEWFVAWVAEADVPGAELYGYQVDGPWKPDLGHRYDLSKVLLDPYAEQVWFPPRIDRTAAATRYESTEGRGPLAVLPRRVDRADEVSSTKSPLRPARPVVAVHERVVYEVHVKNFTASAPFVEPGERGTFRGLIAALDHLVALGVTTIELMPIHEVDPSEGSHWGYMPLAFGAVTQRYAAGDVAADEFASFVDAAHERGLEVMIDVVLNHTTEGDEHGPTWSMRGVDNLAYYVIDRAGGYRNEAGCGNIVRAGDESVGRLLLWALERFADLGVDGFRFDLAATLARDVRGTITGESALIDEIARFGKRRGLHLVAEPWDLGAYLLGSAFPNETWSQWNDRFRDAIRSFLRGEPGMVHEVCRRVEGSPDIFDGEPYRGINFVTAHDGFTLWDLVSYDHKHNEANGRDNTDGSDANLSWNCGWEGDHEVPDDVVDLRHRQVRNALVLLLMSGGTPMLLGGDEMGRTQLGNNNPYNLDDETSWFDWERARSFADLERFVAHLVRFRRRHPSIGRPTPWGADVEWLVPLGRHVDDPELRSTGWVLRGAALGDDDIAVFVNASWEPCTFALPSSSGWRRVVDTAADPSACIVGFEDPTALVSADEIVLEPRSSVVFVAPLGAVAGRQT
jgi:isoamylase